MYIYLFVDHKKPRRGFFATRAVSFSLAFSKYIV